MNVDSISKHKKIIITGGAGAIGSNLVRKLIELGVDNIVIIDNLDSGIRENIPDDKRVYYINGCISDQSVIDRAFNGGADIVFHLAANFANQNSIDNPEKDLITNILGTLKLLIASKAAKVSKFIYASTSCIYNKNADVLCEGDTNLDFETPYAISKYSAEQYGIFYSKYQKLPFASLRIFNSYGPFEYPGAYRNVIPNFFHLALKGQPLRVMGDGNDSRNFTYVDDVVCGMIMLSLDNQSSGQIFNIGSNNPIKIIDLANKINMITKNKAEIKFVPKRDWDKTKSRMASLEKIKKQIDYRPTVDIDEGLLKYHKWIKKQKYEDFDY